MSGAFPDFEVVAWAPGRSSVGAKYAIVWSPPAEALREEGGLQAVFNLGAGVDHLLALPGLAEIPIYRLEDAGMARQMSEYVIHALASISRGFDFYDHEQARGQWVPLAGIRYDEWPVGVMGLGKLGMHVANSVAALGYPVAGWARSPKTMPGIEVHHGRGQFVQFLNRTRVLVNLLPLTSDTRGIINAELIHGLKPQAIVINIARGAHVVDADLLAALDSGKVQAAILDVFNEEPLPAGHPYWAHPRVRITPHVAAITLEAEARSQIVTRISQLERGESADGLVQREAGY